MFNERFARIVLWALAVVVPGGLVMLALWAGVQAIKARYLARDVLPDLPAAAPERLPKALPAPAPVPSERAAA